MKYLIAFLLLSVLSCFTNIAFGCTQIPQASYEANSYYQSTSGLTGTDLKQALNLIIKDHQDYSYSPCMWTILAIADEHPNDANSVIAFYTRRAILKTDRDQGGNTPDYWNREHVWPNSHGFPSRNQHAYRDAHQLRAADKSVNADRGNDDFAEGGSPHSECTLCNQGAGTWEPPDEIKGDTARIMFYMATRYEGNDDSGVSDLELVDSLTSVGDNEMGRLCDLVNWHLDDPVSSAELQRNDIIYQWQGNRNPFIDHPEFVLPIWGEQCGIAAPTNPTAFAIPMPFWAMLTLLLSLSFMATAFIKRI